VALVILGAGTGRAHVDGGRACRGDVDGLAAGSNGYIACLRRNGHGIDATELQASVISRRIGAVSEERNSFETGEATQIQILQITGSGQRQGLNVLNGRAIEGEGGTGSRGGILHVQRVVAARAIDDVQTTEDRAGGAGLHGVDGVVATGASDVVHTRSEHEGLRIVGSVTVIIGDGTGGSHISSQLGARELDIDRLISFKSSVTVNSHGHRGCCRCPDFHQRREH